MRINREQILKISKGDHEIAAYISMLTQTIEKQAQRIVQLENRVKELERQLGQNSQNSSKPPSSDGFLKPTNLRQAGGKKGAPKGHDGHTLRFVEAPDHIVKHQVSVCSACAASLENVAPIEYEKRQVFDLPAPRVVVTEHRAEKKCCPHCLTILRASFPAYLPAPAQYGEGFAAWTAYLSVYQALPLARIGQLFADLTGYRPSDATLLSYLKAMDHKLKPLEQTIREQLLNSPFLHCDETGLGIEGSIQWLHTASTAEWTLLAVHPSRGSKGMNAIGILPTYTGTVMHDSYKAYFKDEYAYSHSLCCAHLMRECQGITENDGHQWSFRMKELLRESWKLACDARNKSEPVAIPVLRDIERQYDEILELVKREWAKDLLRPKTGPRGRKMKSKAANLGQRFVEYKEAILRFLYDARAPFDNNQAERDIRMVKVKCKVSGCFRTDQGAASFARIRSVISTLLKQNRPVLSSLVIALHGQFSFG